MQHIFPLLALANMGYFVVSLNRNAVVECCP